MFANRTTARNADQLLYFVQRDFGWFGKEKAPARSSESEVTNQSPENVRNLQTLRACLKYIEFKHGDEVLFRDRTDKTWKLIRPCKIGPFSRRPSNHHP